MIDRIANIWGSRTPTARACSTTQRACAASTPRGLSTTSGTPASRHATACSA